VLWASPLYIRGGRPSPLLLHRNLSALKSAAEPPIQRHQLGRPRREVDASSGGFGGPPRRHCDRWQALCLEESILLAGAAAWNEPTHPPSEPKGSKQQQRVSHVPITCCHSENFCSNPRITCVFQLFHLVAVEFHIEQYRVSA